MEISGQDLNLVLHALHAVCPTGGGSKTWSLIMKIREQNPEMDIDCDFAIRLQEVAHRELTIDLEP